MPDSRIDSRIIEKWKWIYDPAPPYVLKDDILRHKYENMRDQFTVTQLKLKAEFLNKVADLVESEIQHMDVASKVHKVKKG
jgi:diaminopimelate decarboxylase